MRMFKKDVSINVILVKIYVLLVLNVLIIIIRLLVIVLERIMRENIVMFTVSIFKYVQDVTMRHFDSKISLLNKNYFKTLYSLDLIPKDSLSIYLSSSVSGLSFFHIKIVYLKKIEHILTRKK